MKLALLCSGHSAEESESLSGSWSVSTLHYLAKACPSLPFCYCGVYPIVRYHTE